MILPHILNNNNLILYFRFINLCKNGYWQTEHKLTFTYKCEHEHTYTEYKRTITITHARMRKNSISHASHLYMLRDHTRAILWQPEAPCTCFRFDFVNNIHCSYTSYHIGISYPIVSYNMISYQISNHIISYYIII